MSYTFFFVGDGGGREKNDVCVVRETVCRAVISTAGWAAAHHAPAPSANNIKKNKR